MPVPKKLMIANNDVDKRTPISVIRDELKYLKSLLPTQNIILSPLIRKLPADLSGFFYDASQGYIISVEASTANLEISIPFNNNDYNSYVNGTTFRIINVGTNILQINDNTTNMIATIDKGETKTLIYYSSPETPLWVTIPGFVNFLNFTK